MADVNPEDLLFVDDEEIFAKEEQKPDQPEKADSSINEQWKVMIVDDEKDIHDITKLSFRNFEFEHKSIHFYHAYSGAEARKIIQENYDIAVILLDVVMEEEDAGLQFARYLRNELKNTLTRVIIRTGQPGQAPEKKVIIEYDINDYKEKTDLTQDKFYASMVMGLRSYRDLLAIEKSKEEMWQTIRATNRFLPHEFLKFLNKEHITEVNLGDHVELEMTIFFLDIRSFTLISENLTPHEDFEFLNEILSHIEPAIIQQEGFIDKYIGDAIMVLFPGPAQADHALLAAIDMFKSLQDYNKVRIRLGGDPIDIGISISNGMVALGTVGFHDRMDCTVISDVVNSAAKLERMNKLLGSNILITDQTFNRLQHQDQFHWRRLGKLRVKGKSRQISIVEIFDTDKEEIKLLKQNSIPLFKQAVSLYHRKKYSEAVHAFQQILTDNPQDSVAAYFIRHCEVRIKSGENSA